MLEFKKLGYENYDTVKKHFISDNNTCREMNIDITCDYVFGTTFLWRDFYNTKFATVDDNIILQISCGGTDMFSVPIGHGNKENALSELKKYAHSNGIALYFTFIPEDRLPLFRKVFDIAFVSEEPDWNDYVYNIAPLIDYPGRAYHGQKNFLNRFKKQNPDATFLPISKSNADLVLEYARKWHKEYSDNSQMANAEDEAIFDILTHWEENKCLTGGFISSRNEICGFTVAEAVGDTVYIHIEKAEHGISGAYQFLSSEFLSSVTDNNIKWVNREEDMGIVGLRRSKTALHPAKLLKKYTLYCC